MLGSGNLIRGGEGEGGTIILIIAHPPHWIALHIRTLDTAHHDLLPNLASATAEQYQQALTIKHYFGFKFPISNRLWKFNTILYSHLSTFCLGSPAQRSGNGCSYGSKCLRPSWSFQTPAHRHDYVIDRIDNDNANKTDHMFPRDE